MKLTISARYGAVDSVHTAPHTGIDIVLPQGTPLYNYVRGTVTQVVDHGNASIGKGVILQETDGHTAIYGHLSSVNVHAGQTVGQGGLIGYSGNTGHSTGAHLHFGLMEHGHYVDPTPYVQNVVAPSDWWGKLLYNLYHNGKVGDGINDIPNHSLWGWLGEKATNWITNGFTDWLLDYITALPALAVVCVGVYSLCRMFSKTVAKWAVIGVLLYGALII